MPIRSLLFVLVTIVLLPFALFSVLEAYYHSESLIAEAQGKQLRVATRIAKELSYALEDRKKLAITLARRPELARPGTLQCNQLMRDFKSLHEDILGAGFLDRDGVHRCMTTAGSNPPMPASLADTEWFQQIASERVPRISRPYFGKVRKQWLVVVAAPVLDSAGQFKGAVSLPLNLAALLSVEGYHLPRDTLVTVTDADGTIITRSDMVEQWLGQKLGTAGLPASPIGVDGAVRAANDAGTDSVIAVANLPEIGWRVIATSPAAIILAPARQQFAIAVSLLVVLTLATLFAAYWIARYISTPIQDLANTALRVAAGQSGRRAIESGPREIAELARKFNTMMDERERYVASQEALAERDRRIHDLIQNRTILVREVHHRIKNHLQGLLGLVEDCQGRRPEAANDLETLQGQILSLAAVHGLQARQVSEDVRLGELLRQQVDLLQHGHADLDVVIEDDGAVGERVISSGDAVPIALVITELLINARKHGTGRINVRLFRTEGAVRVGIGNPVTGCAGVDVVTGEGFGTGLALVKAMLVNLGEITISCTNDRFQAEVVLPEQTGGMP